MFEWLEERIERLKSEGIDPSRAEAHMLRLQKMLEEVPKELQLEISILSERYKELRKSLERANADSEVSWSPPFIPVWSELDPKALFRFKINGKYIYFTLVGNTMGVYTDIEQTLTVIPVESNRVSIALLERSEDGRQ